MAQGTNFPEFPLAITGQSTPGLPKGNGGNRLTAAVAGVKIGGTKTKR